jgi:hypothetical protein
MPFQVRTDTFVSPSLSLSLSLFVFLYSVLIFSDSMRSTRGGLDGRVLSTRRRVDLDFFNFAREMTSLPMRTRKLRCFAL